MKSADGVWSTACSVTRHGPYAGRVHCAHRGARLLGDVASTSEDLSVHTFIVGMNEWESEFAPYATFRAGESSAGPRLCHVYTYWDIAHHDPVGGDKTHILSGLIDWITHSSCDEVLVSFQGPQQAGAESPPTATSFESAFVAFQALTHAGKPLHAWAGKLTFTPWNEPNNAANSGNGLHEAITPELAAAYYLAARRHCSPSSGCTVAAGDFATNGGTAADIEWNCANDNVAGDKPDHCAAPSPENPADKPPSYLDWYKHFIATHATDYGLAVGFRPEVMAYHPWHDVNAYIESNAECTDYHDCVTRRLLRSLQGSWGAVAIWDTEIGVGLQASPAPSKHEQACGAAFLVRLTDLSSRIKRVYYMRFDGGNGPLVESGSVRPAGHVLATRALDAPGGCPAMGIPGG